MRAPSKNMSASLRSQSPAGNKPVHPEVTKQRMPRQGVIPGESGTENPPGMENPRSTKPYARAVGGHFGGGS